MMEEVLKIFIQCIALLTASLINTNLFAQTHTSDGTPVTNIDDHQARDMNGRTYTRSGDYYIAPDGTRINAPRRRSTGRTTRRHVASLDGMIIGGPIFYGPPLGPEPDHRECYFFTHKPGYCTISRPKAQYSTPTYFGSSCTIEITKNKYLRSYMKKLCHDRWLPLLKDIKNPALDDDRDGVKNRSDFCPETVEGEKVWKFGEWAGCASGQRPITREW